MLLDVLFDRGLFPTYAFPTDVCSFVVFERDGVNVRIKERPQQSKDKALSEYAKGLAEATGTSIGCDTFGQVLPQYLKGLRVGRKG